ncbi:ABC transporter permease [Marisediminicola senii]|uniref:ABC transporter permease n=1 Tax=Marisediminicola senii TaxID=2711233 RepID=UPI0013EB1F0D|nr:ABC transporter permease subunit [Marisediminicola senii]
MSIHASSLSAQPAPTPSGGLRLPGDPGTRLTDSRGARRAGRVLAATLLGAWFVAPLLPLALWAFADRWSFPSVLPTAWGTSGVESAIAQGAVPALWRSIALGLVVAAIATPLGAMAARALTLGTVRWPRIVGLILLAPVALPPFAAVMGLNVVLLRAYVPPLVGLVLVLVVIALPYTTFAMRVAYAAHDVRYEEEARTLGASPWRVLWLVHIPLVAPALARAAFLAFLVGWSDYVVTVIIGGGAVVSLPLVIASSAAGIGNDSTVAILSLAAVVPPLALLAVLAFAGRPRTHAQRVAFAEVHPGSHPIRVALARPHPAEPGAR